jgi:hypothetical protein
MVAMVTTVTPPPSSLLLACCLPFSRALFTPLFCADSLEHSDQFVLKDLLKKDILELGAVAHTCNPSYSGGGDQEDQGSRPAQAKSCQDLISSNDWAQWHTSVIPIGGSWSRPAQAPRETIFQK